MSKKINSHVTRLYGFLPFSAEISEIVTELQKTDQALDIATKAVRFVRDAVRTESFKLIILTGNAGHGKTYLCKKVLEEFLGDSESAAELIRGSSEATFCVEKSGKRLSILKDLSGLSPIGGAEELRRALESDSPTVVCANDGRLREVLSHFGKVSEGAIHQIARAVEAASVFGGAGVIDEVAVVDLNLQSVVAQDGNNFVHQALRRWVVDGRSWDICDSCSSARNCPIFRNRQMLGKGPDSERRRRGIVHLFETMELSGRVVTIREMLMLLAFVITGGLSCTDVHARVRRPRGWQSKHAFYNAIFAHELSSDEFECLKVLKALSLLDPGHNANRGVDDRFLEGIQPAGYRNDLDLCFVDGNRSRNALDFAQEVSLDIEDSDAANLSKSLCRALSILRRRDFFDLIHKEVTPEEERESRACRVGYSFLADMVWLLDENSEKDNQRLVGIKKNIIAGLHAVQGISPWGRDIQGSSLLVVHPAFIRLQKETSLLAGIIAASRLELRSRSLGSEATELDGVVAIENACDLRALRVYLRVTLKDQEPVELSLDLERFEYLCLAGRGFLSRDFFSADIRRVHNFISRLGDLLQCHDEATLEVTTSRDGRQRFEVHEGLIQ